MGSGVDVSGIDVNLAGPPDSGIGVSLTNPIMGIPVPVETSASLPQLGVSDVNLVVSPEPEITFVSALDTPSIGSVGSQESGTLAPVAQEAPSGKVEVDIKVCFLILILKHQSQLQQTTFFLEKKDFKNKWAAPCEYLPRDTSVCRRERVSA